MGKSNLSAGASRVFGAFVFAAGMPAFGADAPAATGVPASEPPRQVEIIVVTAEKRDENLQDAAVAAVVLNGADLTRNSIDNIDDLEFATPSLMIATAGQSNQMNMRGIGKFDSGGTSTSAVATYRDGVGTVSGFLNQEPYYDVDTVEVLRGPQGTYVGENAAGGAIFVNTQDPVIGGGYDGLSRAATATTTPRSCTGAVNIPLSDTFAMRLPAATRRATVSTMCSSTRLRRSKIPPDPGEMTTTACASGCCKAHRSARAACSRSTTTRSTTADTCTATCRAFRHPSDLSPASRTATSMTTTSTRSATTSTACSPATKWRAASSR